MPHLEATVKLEADIVQLYDMNVLVVKGITQYTDVSSFINMQ